MVIVFKYPDNFCENWYIKSCLSMCLLVHMSRAILLNPFIRFVLAILIPNQINTPFSSWVTSFNLNSSSFDQIWFILGLKDYNDDMSTSWLFHQNWPIYFQNPVLFAGFKGLFLERYTIFCHIFSCICSLEEIVGRWEWLCLSIVPAVSCYLCR